MRETKGHLLVVDDDAWTRYALTRLLKLKGFHVLAASTLAQGLDLLDTGPDCVILDLGLPDGRGEAILRKVREEGLASRVVVCSVIADARRLEVLKSLQPDAILTKPVELRDILHACCS